MRESQLRLASLCVLDPTPNAIAFREMITEVVHPRTMRSRLWASHFLEQPAVTTEHRGTTERCCLKQLDDDLLRRGFGRCSIRRPRVGRVELREPHDEVSEQRPPSLGRKHGRLAGEVKASVERHSNVRCGSRDSEGHRAQEESHRSFGSQADCRALRGHGPLVSHLTPRRRRRDNEPGRERGGKSPPP